MSMTRDAMAQVSGCETPREVWKFLEQTYASRSKAQVINTRMAPATTQKGNMSISGYLAKMKSLVDDMASTGKALEEEELVSYILAGLNFDFNPVVSAIVSHVEPISIGELYSQLLSFEARTKLSQGGHQPGGHDAPGGRGHGNGGRGSFFLGNNTGGKKDKSPCQVCGKIGHFTLDCWYRFDESYTSDYNNSKSVAAAIQSYGVDTNWYTDIAATDHITGELDKLTAKDKYKGQDQIHNVNNTHMDICNIGHVVINPPPPAPTEFYTLTMFFMYQKQPKILYLFIIFLMIIMPHLNISLIIF
jgi:hypothetical protein